MSNKSLLRAQQSLDPVYASLVDYSLITPAAARVIMTLSNASGNKVQTAAAITNALDKQFAPILKSFRVLRSSSIRPIIAGFVTANKEVLSLRDERVQGFRAVTASILLDPSDNSTWNICTDPHGAKFVLREGSEDIGRVLETAKMRDTSAPRLRNLVNKSRVGEFAAFVNDSTVKYGFVVNASADSNTIQIITPEDESPIEVDEDTVIEAVLPDSREKVIASEVGIDPNGFGSGTVGLSEYYKSLYAYAPEYITLMEDALNQNSVI